MRSVTFTKSNTPPCVFFTFFKLYKWYQIAQRITYKASNFVCSTNQLTGSCMMETLVVHGLNN